MKWNIIKGSVSGANKSLTGKPCQDSSGYKLLDDFWGIAMVSDGAGSMENSHLASSFIVNQTITNCAQFFENEEWFIKQEIPDADIWRTVILSLISQTNSDLKKYADENDLDYKELGATVILVLFCNKGILSLNIGDGRSCYQKKDDNSWCSLTTPYKGEEAGSTIFLNTEWIWESSYIQDCIRTNVMNFPISSFALLSDGMEKYSFTCYTKNEEGIFFDPNEPYDSFFNINTDTMRKLINDSVDIECINKEWEQYLSECENLKNEYDDKTMLIGFIN